MRAEDIIKALKLEPLPEEGGFYRQTYKSELAVTAGAGGEKYGRVAGTAIYYLITPEDFSALHRVKHDEVFHFYLGDPAEMVQITREGELRTIRLGPNIAAGDELQVWVPPRHWQGLKVAPGGSWSLVGATVSPGFELEDFEVGTRLELLKQFPQHAAVIKRYTR